MNYAEYLAQLLRPLGVYDMEQGSFQRAELEGQGAALDRCGEKLDLAAREMILWTAENVGLTAVEALLPYRPVTQNIQRRRAAVAALLRIDEGSFTLQAINDNLAGCGLNAKASETGVPGYVQITFPEVPGVPDGYEELKKIIEEILPAHLGVEYTFWYVDWAMLEERFSQWSDFGSGFTWEDLEKMRW